MDLLLCSTASALFEIHSIPFPNCNNHDWVMWPIKEKNFIRMLLKVLFHFHKTSQVLGNKLNAEKGT